MNDAPVACLEVFFEPSVDVPENLQNVLKAKTEIVNPFHHTDQLNLILTANGSYSHPVLDRVFFSLFDCTPLFLKGKYGRLTLVPKHDKLISVFEE